jgi:hypothetical protein
MRILNWQSGSAGNGVPRSAVESEGVTFTIVNPSEWHWHWRHASEIVTDSDVLQDDHSGWHYDASARAASGPGPQSQTTVTP